ncbi:conserved hypothetical protein [Tenacibaculum maritimum]|uniref:retron system putative HNH endonuclease n=1 Tax=Tenacibaculum maritimum TaxID=107401 RepID=UPI0012E424C3|nr:retron system putative HNH endonuclease [Tenacibaculum maritimum]CAA0159493.1 conserved hypothetical protein [Tenacibaculum maritimum]CAA0231030.1 conserved hypothetical protein [Tenacibaculum maritimum]
MRFIEKEIEAPSFLIHWINEFKKSDLNPTFKDLKGQEKKDFRTILFNEQKQICCYCEQEITNDHKSVLEHFLPQSQFKRHELDYYNLHLSCTHDNQYCDTSKANDLIVNVLLHPECESFFKYNTYGEILPNTHEYANFKDFLENKKQKKLRNKHLAIIHLISVLKLNSESLKNERKKTYNDLLKAKTTLFDTKKKIEDYINKEKLKNKSIRFPSLIFYFLNFWKGKLP